MRLEKIAKRLAAAGVAIIMGLTSITPAFAAGEDDVNPTSGTEAQTGDVDGSYVKKGEFLTYTIDVFNNATGTVTAEDKTETPGTKTFTVTDKVPEGLTVTEISSPDNYSNVDGYPQMLDENGSATTDIGATRTIVWKIVVKNTQDKDNPTKATVGFKAQVTNTHVEKYVNTADVTVDEAKETTNETTNYPIREAKIKVVKYDGTRSKNAKKLGGAEFRISKDGDESFVLDDGTTNIVTGNDKSANADPAYGESKEYELVDGKYSLVETKAPDGYFVSNETTSFTVETSKEGSTITILSAAGPQSIQVEGDKTIEIAVYDDQITALPNTGGEGRYMVYLTALMLGTVCAAAIAIKSKAKKCAA